MLREPDPHRPRFHFTAPEGFCSPFDPNGAIYWRGRYHLFYIYQDERFGHAWGHASSRDLIRWIFHPPALIATDEDPEEGIFSGSAFLTKDGRPGLIYYGINAGICVALAADDDLERFVRLSDNPVIPEPRRGDTNYDVYRVFDPHAWWDGERYNVILGGRVKPHDLRDTAYLFTSPDLVDWAYQRPFYNPNPHWTDENEDCACPDFFRLGDKDVLMCISHARGLRYYVGRVESDTFIPESHHRMNFPGGPCFAPESLEDNLGRRIVWSWVLPAKRERETFATMTLPRVLSPGTSDGLRVEPARELEILRRRFRSLPRATLDDSVRTHASLAGTAFELRLAIRPLTATQVGVIVRAAPNGIEETRITYNAIARALSIDTTKASLDPAVFRPFPMISNEPKRDLAVQTAPLTIDEILELTIFVDQSIIEVFANDELVLTARTYPTLAGSRQTRVFATGGVAEFSELHAWDLAALTLLPHVG